MTMYFMATSLENVKNLMNHDKGKTFTVIRRTLKEERGYNVHWKVTTKTDRKF